MSDQNVKAAQMCIRDSTEDGGASPYDYAKTPLAHDDLKIDINRLDDYELDVYKRQILHGDTLKLVKAFQPGIFDAVITDPPYASGGTKQNERNRTTNQKYSSMLSLIHISGTYIATYMVVPKGKSDSYTITGKVTLTRCV